MKKLVIVAAVALAACGGAETEEPMAEEEAVVEEPAVEVAMAADGLPLVGTFEVNLVTGADSG